jgi:exodeoxyribonuclease VII small subunit
MARKELSFEDALKRLEEIASEIEGGKIGLEESITRYEEGMKLVTRCRDILCQAEQRIKKVQPTPTGDLEAVPLEAPNEPSQQESRAQSGEDTGG